MAVGTTPSENSLPTVYDKLVPIGSLRYDRHNPRRVAPTKELVASIRRDGIQQPLIVWPDPDEDVYYITDGWQRYQAATRLGWEQLPVIVHDTIEEALEATENASIVREWSTYTWAKFCESVAEDVDESSFADKAEKVADRVVKSESSVYRYLSALSLPEETHVLLADGPEGTDEEWQVLANYQEGIRRYNGLSWVVAAKIGRAYYDGKISTSRAIEIAANAVRYDAEMGMTFVDEACKKSDYPVTTIHQLIHQDDLGSPYLQIPHIPVTEEEKRQIMEYCARKRTPLSSLIADLVEEFAQDLPESER